MARERNTEEQAVFQSALDAVSSESDLSVEQHDALNILEGADVETFRREWSRLPAGARARLVRSMHKAASDRLRLDYSWLNHMALQDEDPQVRLAAVQAALEDQSAALFDRLLTMLRSDPVGAIRRAVAEDLSRFSLLAELEGLDPDSTRRLREALTDRVNDPAEEPGVRSTTLAALGYFSDEEVADLLGSGFTDRDLRPGAVRGMGRSADPRWTDRLLPVLGSDDPHMRTEAARALGEIEDERAVGQLTNLVDDPERTVRLAVIEALGAIGGDEAREALLYLLEDADEQIRDAAHNAISRLEGEEEDPLDL